MFVLSQRRLSIDQLTEEAEADLANNNDPNNNAASGPDAQVQDLNLQNISQDHEVGEPSGHGFVDSTSNVSKYNYFDDDDDDDDDLEDPFQVQLQNDIDLIMKLMPDRNYDEVRYMLESHQNNPSRVQVSFGNSVKLLRVKNIYQRSEIKTGFYCFQFTENQ